MSPQKRSDLNKNNLLNFRFPGKMKNIVFFFIFPISRQTIKNKKVRKSSLFFEKTKTWKKGGNFVSLMSRKWLSASSTYPREVLVNYF